MKRLLSGRVFLAILGLATVAQPGCGSGPTGPNGPPTPMVFSIDPSRGPVTGGTAVRITGGNFGPGAVVTIGGVPAIELAVESATVISAKTGAHASGVVEVTVTVGTQSGTLPSAFTYDVVVANNPPVITALTVRGVRPNEPLSFADLGEEVNVTATVQDESPIDRLTFEWTADPGIIIGTGPAVRWRAPADFTVRTPFVVPLTLTVVERYVAQDDAGRLVDREHRVARTVGVDVHNSTKEVGDLAREFLLDFSDSTKAPAFVVRNFSKSARCEGERDSEFNDVEKNRTYYRIDSSNIGAATVTFQFGGKPCSVEPRDGDSCATVHAMWQSTCLVTNPECIAGEKPRASGVDYVTAVYEQSQWRLCASHFKPDPGTIVGPMFIR
jgi:hypothetical protein